MTDYDNTASTDCLMMDTGCFVDHSVQCRVCTRYIKKLRVAKYDTLCSACWKKLGPSLRLSLKKQSMDVQTAGIFEDAMPVKQQTTSAGHSEQDLSSGFSGEQIAFGASLDREESKKEVLSHGDESSREVPLSSRGRDLSRHLLWSQKWLDFTSRLEKKHQNLDKLEMEKGQFTDYAALESDSMASGLCSDGLDEDTTFSDSEDSSFGSYMEGQEEESDSDYSGDLSIMVEDREDQEEDGYVFDSMIEDFDVQCEEHVDSVILICCHNCRRESLPVCPSEDGSKLV